MTPNRLRVLLFLFVSLCSISSFAQAPWRATLSLNPRPTPYIDEWKSNGSIGTLTIFNPESSLQQILIFFEVRNLSTNAMVLRGRSSTQTASPFPSPTILSNNNFVGSSGLQYDESQKTTMVRTGMFPEGQYSICLRIENLSHQQLAENICANFTIEAINPPQLINPEQQRVFIVAPNSFSWTPVLSPSGIPANYELKVVEILKGQSPAVAIEHNIAVVEGRNINGPTFLPQPDQTLNFKNGAHFAWRVQALDGSGKSFARNNGYSEIGLFSLVEGTNKQAKKVNAPVSSTVKGLLNYAFADPFGKEGLELSTLKNIDIRLVLRNYTLAGNQKNYYGDDSVIGAGKTDASGNYSFITSYADTTGAIGMGGVGKKNINNGNGQPLYREAFLFIDDIHYTSPEKGIVLDPGKTIDAGMQFGLVKSFGLRVNVKDIKPPYTMGGATVYLIRAKKADHIPDEEGSPRPNKPEYIGPFAIIGKVVSDNYGRADFGRLVKCFADEQYLIVVSPPSSHSGYEYTSTIYPEYEKTSFIFAPIMTTPTMNSDYSWEQYNLEMAPSKITSSVKGKLVLGFEGSKDDKKPLANTDLKLEIRYLNPGILPAGFAPESYPDNGKDVAFATTNANGEFLFTFTDVPNTSSFQGLKRVYRIISNESSCSSPDDDITLEPGEEKNIGVVRSDLRTYNVVVHAQHINSKQPMPGTYVYARLPYPTDSFPYDEGSPHPNPEMFRSGELVVAVALTDENGDATLSRIGKGYHMHKFELVSDPKTGKNFLGFVSDDFSSYWGDGTEFNSEYLIPTYHKTVNMIPLPPVITGRVLRQDNNIIGIAGAQIWMTNTPQPDWKPQDVVVISDKDGYYVIDGNKNKGFERHVQASKLGYEKSAFVDIPNLNDGEQAYNNLFLMPKGVVTGKVYHKWYSSETGQIGAWVTVEGGSSAYTYSEFSLPTNLDESGYVYVESENSSYFGDTINAYSPHATSFNIGKIDLIKKLHRIKIVSIDEETNTLISSQYVIPEMPSPGYPGAVIPPANWGADTLMWTPFESSDNYFPFTMYTNTDQYYEHRSYNIHNPLSKDFITYLLKTKRAGYITGKVYLYTKKGGSSKTGKGSKFGNPGQTMDDLSTTKGDPVPYAKIRMDQSSSGSGNEMFVYQPPKIINLGAKPDVELTTSTDESYTYSNAVNLVGVYQLGNISVGKHLFKASKSKSGTIGDQKTVTVTKEGVKNVDFYLRVYDDMDITEMLGFSMDVEKLDSLPTGVFISGSFSELPSSEHFRVDKAQELAFNNIKITPSQKKNSKGIPYPKPTSLPVVTNETELPITYHYSPTGFYQASLKPVTSKLTITAPANEQGSIGGKVYIPANQFSSKVLFATGTQNGFYLGLPNKSAPGNLEMPVITADGKDAYSLNPNGLHIVNSKGVGGNYTLLSFNASIDADNSWLRGDSVTIATTLNLPDIVKPNKTVPLVIGNVRLRGKDIAISLPPNASLPEIALDTWKLQGQHITFSGDNLSMDGVLKTGSVDVPFTAMPITPQGWKPDQAVFVLSNLSISSVIPLALNCPVKFGHDIGAKPPCWNLYSNQGVNSTAGSFAGISGMAVGDSIYVKSFSLTSLGSKSFELKQNVPIHLFTYLMFFPASLYVAGPGTIEISGYENLNIMNGFSASSRILSLTASNGTLFFDIKDYIASGTRMNFLVNDMDINQNGFFASGTLVDDPHPSAYSFPVILSRTPDSTAIAIQAQDSKNKPTTFPITKDGSRSISNVVGGMQFDYNTHHWSNLLFSGSLSGANGASGVMSFKVSGAVQTDGAQKIAVTNIPTPFGNATMTFNFSTGAMHGAVDLDADLPGAGHLDGQADLEIDKSGWYFAACGDLQISNPNIGIKAALVLGSYPGAQSIPEITEKFNQIPWKPEVPKEMRTLPQAYNTLSGFYFCGECTNFLGISLPSIDVDLDPIVHCSVSFYYGAALSLGMNFSVGTQFDVGAAAFIGIDADAGGSIGIACGGGTLHAGLNMYGVGSFNTSTGHWSIAGGSDLNLTGELYAGWGVCSSSCGWYTCDKHTWGPATMTFGLIGFKVGTDGFKITY